MSRKIAVRRYSAYKKRNGFKPFLSLLAAVLCCIAFWVPARGLCSDSAAPGGGSRVVIVDPGHGGNDSGVESLEGQVEKKVSLGLAQKLKEALAGRYRVVLTRKGDYGVSPAQRASIANHQQGDLFISLHAGAGFRRLTDRQDIYFFRAPDRDEQGSAAAAAESRGPVSWHLIQQRYAGQSALLAETLQKRLARFQTRSKPEAIGAPLAVLKGLDMPAVVVEYGYLTNPKTAGALAEQQYLEALAEALADGISDFFAIGPAEK